jgi:hypothetical protein
MGLPVGTCDVMGCDLPMAVNADRAGRLRHWVLIGIGLVALGGLPWDRGVQQRAIMVGIGLAAAAGLAREGQARSVARLLAWDEQKLKHYLHEVEGHVEGHEV